MRMVDILERKAAGKHLTGKEIRFVVDGIVNDTIPEYQLSAFLMAVRIRGMNKTESAALTEAMMYSGETLDLSDLPGIKVDKHSSGGVGDTTTLVVAPLVAACGGTVAKMSGRGLSFTGGTLDKLESIPGTCVEQPIERFREIVRENGLCVIGQSEKLDPADKKMYAMRDVTATVASIPLIAASIMSKKLASGTDFIVLDVKVGSGAFIKTIRDAKLLSASMVSMAMLLDRDAVAVVSDMNEPLGLAVGNALEVFDAVRVLSGEIGPGDRLYEMCMVLGSEMLMGSGLAASPEEAKEKLNGAIRSGAGLEKLRNMITALGGDASYLSVDRMPELIRVRRIVNVCAERTGYVGDISTESVGIAAQMLGAGRAKKSDTIDPAVGLMMKKRRGDFVLNGETLAELYVNDETRLGEAIDCLKNAITIQSGKPKPNPLVYSIERTRKS